METGPALALLLMFLVHVAGMAVLIATLGKDILQVFRTRPVDDDGDGGPPPADDPADVPTGGGGGLPLPDAGQTPVRLREPGRIAERYARPARRREHEPERAPAPQER